MTDHKRRVNQLENKAGAGDALPFKAITQDIDDPTLYHDDDGNTYHEADFEALGQRYSLTIIEYTHDWRGDGSKPIQLKWPDDD